MTLDALIATLSSTGALYQDSVALLVPETVEMALATGEQLQRMVKEVGLAKLVGVGRFMEVQYGWEDILSDNVFRQF